MNTEEIERLLKRKCKDSFLGVFAKDRLPRSLPHRRPLSLVCNTDKHDKPGRHWVVLYIGNDSSGEYFDSFAMKPENIFAKFLDKFCKSWIRNEDKVQSLMSKFCGHYCIFYCLFKSLNYEMIDIMNCFIDDTAVND